MTVLALIPPLAVIAFGLWCFRWFRQVERHSSIHGDD